MAREIRLYLEDILESISKIEEYTKDINESEFYVNVEKQDSVLRRLEIIGEAVKNIPQEIKDKYQDIEWKKLAGLRDILIHAYFGVNLFRVWGIIRDDLPKIHIQILNIKATLL
jgi:uncharacterized protein with HEPN domain